MSATMSNMGIQLCSHCVRQILRLSGLKETRCWDSCLAAYNSARPMRDKKFRHLFWILVSAYRVSHANSTATQVKGYWLFAQSNLFYLILFIVAPLLLISLEGFLFTIKTHKAVPFTSLGRFTFHSFLEVALWPKVFRNTLDQGVTDPCPESPE